MWSPFRPRSQFKHYDCIARLNTKFPVTSLGLSPDGGLIGIGSAGGLDVYRDGVELAVPPYQRMFMAVSAIEWVSVELGDLVIFGSRSGWIFILSNAEDLNVFERKSSYRAAETGGVISIATHTMSVSCVRIAVGMSDGVIGIHEYDFRGVSTEVYSIEIGKAIPQALMFEANGTQLLLIGQDNGRMHRIDVHKNEILSELHISPNAGSAAFYGGQVIVDNTVDGYTLYRADNAELVHTFRTQRAFDSIGVQTCFAGTGRWIIGGSDHSKVYVFDVQQECLRDTFKHKGLVTYVKASDFIGGHIVACAADTEVSIRRDSQGPVLDTMKPSQVTVWRSTSSGSSRAPRNASRMSFADWMSRIAVAGCICSTAYNSFKYLESAPFAQGILQAGKSFFRNEVSVETIPVVIATTATMDIQTSYTVTIAATTVTSDSSVTTSHHSNPTPSIYTTTVTSIVESASLHTAAPASTSTMFSSAEVAVPMEHIDRRDFAVIHL